MTPKLIADLRRRSAIEAEIGHMKTDGRLSRCPLKGIDAATLSILIEATDEMERCWEAGDLLANVEADLHFHRTIALPEPDAAVDL